MAQRDHVEVGDQPVDLTAGLPAGCYIAQVVRPSYSGALGCLYATAAAAPLDERDWFLAHGGSYFTFVAGGSEPTWAKTAVDGTLAVLAVASYAA